MLVLDAGGVSALAGRSRRSVALIAALQAEGLWPPVVLTPPLIETLQGDGARDAAVNRLLKTCDVVDDIPLALARRAARLRSRARAGSAIDALVVASAEPGGSVLTSDVPDLSALAIFADDVEVAGV